MVECRYMAHTGSDTMKDLERRLGYAFTDKDLLIQALTHRSFSNEHRNAVHNERLEFLGDAVLQFVSTAELYRRYPDEPEGVLSIYRSLLVKTDFLVRVATVLGISAHLRVSTGQRKEMERNVALLADAVEAVIGAVFLDGGIEAARECIHTHILTNVQSYLAQAPLRDAKTALQEAVQRDLRTTPVYTVLDERGPDHEKVFTVAVVIGDTQYTQAEGRSKQDAEQRAAQKALKAYEASVPADAEREGFEPSRGL